MKLKIVLFFVCGHDVAKVLIFEPRSQQLLKVLSSSVHDARINLNFQSNSLPCGFQLSVSRITTILPTVRLHYSIISPPSNLSLLVLFTFPALLHLYQTNSSQNSTC